VRKLRKRGEEIRQFILSRLSSQTAEVPTATAEKFKISRQAVNKHFQKLVDGGALIARGKTRRKTYELAPVLEWTQAYPISPALAEDEVWREDIAPRFGEIPDNVKKIWQYGFTEMFNNAVDHSNGREITVSIKRTAHETRILIQDDGIGIFKKIQTYLGLTNQRHAILELAKGKFTTDPKRHSGEGIFFTSRVFDRFSISSGELFFAHDLNDHQDWMIESNYPASGTLILMTLNNHTARTTKHIMDQFAVGDDFGFDKTIVPVRLAKLGEDNLISRSQAKRLLTRIDRFKTVVFDFKDVKIIGQAFADEIFRVFASEHPEISIQEFEANAEVCQMITRARNLRRAESGNS